MTTNASSKRNEFNSGSDTGSNNPTAHEAHRNTPKAGRPEVNTGRLSNGYVGDSDNSKSSPSPGSIIRDE